MTKKVARKVKSVLTPSLAKLGYVLALVAACALAKWAGIPDCIPCLLEALK